MCIECKEGGGRERTGKFSKSSTYFREPKFGPRISCFEAEKNKRSTQSKKIIIIKYIYIYKRRGKKGGEPMHTTPQKDPKN